jgi:hypothetical protein
MTGVLHIVMLLLFLLLLASTYGYNFNSFLERVGAAAIGVVIYAIAGFLLVVAIDVFL